MEVRNNTGRNKARDFARGIFTVMASLMGFLGIMYGLTYALKAFLG